MSVLLNSVLPNGVLPKGMLAWLFSQNNLVFQWVSAVLVIQDATQLVCGVDRLVSLTNYFPR